jgi:hypothetical protein
MRNLRPRRPVQRRQAPGKYGDAKLPELLSVLVNCPKAKAASVNDRCKAVYGKDSRWGTSDSLASRSHVRDRGSSSFLFPDTMSPDVHARRERH